MAWCGGRMVRGSKQGTRPAGNGSCDVRATANAPHNLFLLLLCVHRYSLCVGSKTLREQTIKMCRKARCTRQIVCGALWLNWADCCLIWGCRTVHARLVQCFFLWGCVLWFSLLSEAKKIFAPSFSHNWQMKSEDWLTPTSTFYLTKYEDITPWDVHRSCFPCLLLLVQDLSGNSPECVCVSGKVFPFIYFIYLFYNLPTIFCSTFTLPVFISCQIFNTHTPLFNISVPDYYRFDQAWVEPVFKTLHRLHLKEKPRSLLEYTPVLDAVKV